MLAEATRPAGEKEKLHGPHYPYHCLIYSRREDFRNLETKELFERKESQGQRASEVTPKHACFMFIHGFPVVSSTHTSKFRSSHPQTHTGLS